MTAEEKEKNYLLRMHFEFRSSAIFLPLSEREKERERAES